MKRKLKYSVEKFTLNQYNCQRVINIENVKTERNFSHKRYGRNGCGIRLMECVRLRVKDVDFGQNQAEIRQILMEKLSFPNPK